MPSADLLLCLKKRKDLQYSWMKLSFVYRKNSSIVGTTPTPTDVVQVFFPLEHLIKKPWLIYMDTFDLNYTPNRTKLGASVNVKCLFPVTGKTGPALDSTCSSDEKYFRCNTLLRPTFPLIIHSELTQYLCFQNHFRQWKMSSFFFLSEKRGRRPPTLFVVTDKRS